MQKKETIQDSFMNFGLIWGVHDCIESFSFDCLDLHVGDVDAWKDHDYGHGRLIRLAGSAPRCVSTTQTSNQNALSVCLRVPVVGSISAQRTPRWSYQKVRSL